MHGSFVFKNLSKIVRLLGNACQLFYIPPLWNLVISVTLETPKFSFNLRNFLIVVAFVAVIKPPILIFLNVLTLHFAMKHTLQMKSSQHI